MKRSIEQLKKDIRRAMKDTPAKTYVTAEAVAEKMNIELYAENALTIEGKLFFNAITALANSQEVQVRDEGSAFFIRRFR